MSSKAIVPIGLTALAAGTILATGGAAAPIAGPVAAGSVGSYTAATAAAPGLAAFLPSASTVATGALLGGTALQAYGQYQQGEAAKDAADYQSQVMQRQAIAEEAAGQLRANEIRRQGRLVQSRAQALAGASGGYGGNIPRIISDIAAETELRAQLALSGGVNEAIALRSGAQSRRAAGRAGRLAGQIGAAGSLATGGFTLFDRYG